MNQTQRYDILKDILYHKMNEGTPVRVHLLKRFEYLSELENLGMDLNVEFVLDVILQTLPRSFTYFIVKCHMDTKTSTYVELLSLLMST